MKVTAVPVIPCNKMMLLSETSPDQLCPFEKDNNTIIIVRLPLLFDCPIPAPVIVCCLSVQAQFENNQSLQIHYNKLNQFSIILLL